MLVLSENQGIAFGLRLPVAIQPFLIAAALLGVLVLAIRTARSTASRIAYGLILGGALANIIDRLGNGLVTDYVQVGSFPVFNLADSCITVGAMVLIAEALVQRALGGQEGLS